ncbi:MAG TPA: hypothetical protein VEX41_07545, partial [Candidatus Eisenbacteria bacterium]|nr:hypothetical protein [Candidatus Eisenbacteria bacterium]
MFTGSDDFFDLFEAGAAWDEAAGHIKVFKLYGGWTPDFVSDRQLRRAVEDIRRRGMALAVEAGPLAVGDCGAGMESFAGPDEARGFVEQLQRIGATVDFVAFDEPLYFAKLADGPAACHWDAARIAREIVEYVTVVRTAYPAARFGDIEPLIAPLDADDIDEWLVAYEQAVGEPLAFIHMDIDFARPGWQEVALAIEAVGDRKGVETGLIYTGPREAATDLEWIQNAGERVKEYEVMGGGKPDHVVFQSWVDHPDRVLPETDPTTFTGF